MDSNDAKTVAAFLIAEFENEMETTLRVIESVPATISTTGRTRSRRQAWD